MTSIPKAFSPSLAVLALCLVLVGGCGGSDGELPYVPPRVLAPELDAVAPSTGPEAGGTTIALTGQNFDVDPGDTTVTVGGSAATGVVVTSKTALTCVTPPGTEGAVEVAVVTSGGTAALDDGFAYNPPPRLQTVLPASGWVDEDTAVTVLGSGFHDHDAGVCALAVGSEAATDVVVADDGSITATVPAAAAGPVDLLIENANGADALPDAFTRFGYPLEFLAEDVRLDTVAAAGLQADRVVPTALLPFGTAADGRSDNATVVASGARVYVAWREMRNGIADIHFNRSLNGGATWLPGDVRINRGGVGTDTAGDVCLACDGLDVAAVWIDWRSGGTHVYCNASSDGGQTWHGTDVQVSPSAGVADPHLVEVNGTLHVVWASGPGVFYRRSVDWGQTWGDLVRVDTYTPGRPAASRPRVCASGSYVYVAWVSGAEVLFNFGWQEGAAWSVEKRIDQASVGFRGYVEICCFDQLVYAVWQDFRDDVGRIYFRASKDAGAAWGSEVRLDQDGGGSNISSLPKIACAGSNGYVVYVVWLDWRDGSYADVLFRKSITAGADWTLDRRLNTTPASSHTIHDHQIAASGAGLYVVWSDRRNAPSAPEDITFNSSRNGGINWLVDDVRLNVDATGASASLPQIAADGGHVYVVWQDSRPGLSSDLDILVNASQP